MIFTAALGLVLRATSPNKGMGEIIDQIAEFFNSRVTLGMHDNGLIIIRNLAARLRINSNHIASVPNGVH